MSSKAFYLARRHSVKNEPDLLQEDMMGQDDFDLLTPPTSPISQKSCFDMLGKVCPDSPLPPECNQFEEIKVALQRTNSNRANHAIAFEGLPAGVAAAAMSSREKGHLSHAQIQRRMTNSKPRLW